MIQDFAKTLRAELDDVGEGKNAERFAKNFAHDTHDTTIHIPRIFWKTTTTQVLTQERIYGIKINDLTAIDAAGLDRSVLAEHGAHSILKMIFEDGFFHADLHPGNFLIEANGRIGLIDFGMVGIVDENTRQALIHMLVAITRQDTERLVDAFLDLGVTQQAVDRPALQRDQDLLAGVGGLEHFLLSDLYSRLCLASTSHGAFCVPSTRKACMLAIRFLYLYKENL